MDNHAFPDSLAQQKRQTICKTPPAAFSRRWGSGFFRKPACDTPARNSLSGVLAQFTHRLNFKKLQHHIEERRHKKDGIETIHNAAVTRHNAAEIFDGALTLDNRSRKIAEHAQK